MNSADLAKSVATELLGGGSVWLFLLITALFAGAGAYFGKYLGTKGANLATKEDFNILQAQLSASTRLVESVRSEISRTDWVAREWATLRIKKLEELTAILHACVTYLDAKRNASIECRHYPDTPPFNQAIMISELYLPELDDAVNRYILKCRMYDLVMDEFVHQGVTTQLAGDQYNPSIWDSFAERSGHSEMLSIAQEIRTAARQLLQEIVLDKKSDVPKQSRIV